MKKVFYSFLTTLFCSMPLLNAQINTEDVSTQNIHPPAQEEEGGAFLLKANGDYIGKAKVRKCDLDKLIFATALAQASAIYYYDPCYHEGLNVAVNFQRTWLDWKFNPFFRDADLSTVSLLLGAFTERADCWLWRAQVAINFDNIEHWNWRDYMNYDFLLWGRYDYCENVGLHIGFLAQTGMKIDRVYPIVGFDWKYDCHWTFNVIYPVNISAIYTFNKTWSVALAGRFFDQRHRLKKQEFLSEGLWHYQTSGAEIAVNYTPLKWLTANAHIGYDWGGHITIADRHYRHRHRFRLESAPYAGGELTVNF